jgi:hypothetical protein
MLRPSRRVVAEAESDRGEDAGAVAADRAGELDERLKA